jgi:unsaturated rhamnogalacturonyl hydrolase
MTTRPPAFALALFAAGPLAFAQGAPLRLRVTNPLDVARPSETVEVAAATLAPRFAPAELLRLAVTDATTAHEVLSQAVDEDGDGTSDSLVFQADFAPGESKEFTLVRGEPRTPRLRDFRVYGRFVREREDDFAWENDRVAFRVYGPALETFEKEPLTSSAVDAWSKRTPRLVLNDWYLVDDYHHDHGEGGDFYPAGTSRGCGGSGLWSDGHLVVSKNFRSSRVLARGPIRLVFELTYPEWADAPGVKERRRVTLDAGSHFNRFESSYAGLGEGHLTWAAGIRAGEGVASHPQPERGILSTWEFQGRYGDGGWLGCGVVVDPLQVVEMKEAAGNHLVIVRTPAGQNPRWYAGSGWDRSGDFKDAESWRAYVELFARRLNAPLKVEVLP